MVLYQVSFFFMLDSSTRDVIATKVFKTLEDAEVWHSSMNDFLRRFPEILNSIERIHYVRSGSLFS